MNKTEKQRPHIRNSGVTVIPCFRYRIERAPHKNREHHGENPYPTIILIPLIPVRLGTKLPMSSYIVQGI